MVAKSEIRIANKSTGNNNGILKIDMSIKPPVVLDAIPEVRVNMPEKALADNTRLNKNKI